VIDLLGLQPHPEGGHFRETYRSDQILETPFGRRAASTAILYLLAGGEFSAFHRVWSDEMFHFYAGDPVELVLLDEAGCRTITLGPDVAAGQQPQALVPGGTWQALRLPGGGQWALMGCTVAPGFEFEDFELARRDELAVKFPAEESLIRQLTRG
ncbi:MAG: cupin domain-containing protein, partial [Planctomycetota bacterium]|jgi:predicted cupin superfamily sugar epimerase